MKRRFMFLILFLSLLLVGCTPNEDIDNDKLTIVSTIFPGYDFARAIVGDNANVIMLIKPGTEVHSYDPSPKDIINIQKSDVFIYVGGESEEWVSDILSTLDMKHTKVVRLMDYVDLSLEEIKDGMQSKGESSDEYDEHIWTSLRNSHKLVEAIYDAIYSVDDNPLYLENKNSYLSKIDLLDKRASEIVLNSKNKTLIFGDRFPFKYFVLDYGLDYYAAFSGCSSETEASAKTVAFLIDKVRANNIPVVFYLEMSNHKIADVISQDTGAKTLMFHSAHNLTKDEFESGKTYVDIMKQNIDNLEEALK